MCVLQVLMMAARQLRDRDDTGPEGGAVGGGVGSLH